MLFESIPLKTNMTVVQLHSFEEFKILFLQGIDLINAQDKEFVA